MHSERGGGRGKISGEMGNELYSSINKALFTNKILHVKTVPHEYNMQCNLFRFN
jgi:hypothetical protein